jgi:hypothetical protein
MYGKLILQKKKSDILQIHWLQVGSLADNYEKIIDGYVWQADTTGIKAAWDRP